MLNQREEMHLRDSPKGVSQDSEFCDSLCVILHMDCHSASARLFASTHLERRSQHVTSSYHCALHDPSHRNTSWPSTRHDTAVLEEGQRKVSTFWPDWFIQKMFALETPLDDGANDDSSVDAMTDLVSFQASFS